LRYSVSQCRVFCLRPLCYLLILYVRFFRA
jgi:hypothetical protein